MDKSGRLALPAEGSNSDMHGDAELPRKRQIELGDAAGERVQVIAENAVHDASPPDPSRHYTLGPAFS